jgi:hypothetical protein
MGEGEWAFPSAATPMQGEVFLLRRMDVGTARWAGEEEVLLSEAEARSSASFHCTRRGLDADAEETYNESKRALFEGILKYNEW